MPAIDSGPGASVRALTSDDAAGNLSPSAVEGAGAIASSAEARRSDFAVELTGISYTYEGEVEPVLRDISLRVRDGEFVLILGPSGCGKSTLMQLLNGTVPHTLKGKLEGEAVVCGKKVAETKVATFATDVGMVFQDPEAQIINTCVRDEVCFCLENLCRPRDEILTRQAEALHVVGLGEAGGRSIFDLSGGQKQRVSIAAALAARPRLLVLDEPTANLDPVGMAEVFAVLERLNRQSGTTIILVEHRVDELADKISRVIMMDRGQIVFDGPARAAFAARRDGRSDNGEPVPTSAWFPQVAELALDIAEAVGTRLTPDEVPLNVIEAIAYCERAFDRPRSHAQAREVASPGGRDARDCKPLLVIRKLTFGYERATPIIESIDLELKTGGIVGLMGRNGSGKTTLARMLIGINPAPKGTIDLAGKDLAGLGPKEISTEVGYVFQNPDHQFVTDRIDDEVAYGLRVRGYAADAVDRIVGEVLETVDLAAYRHRSPFSLSLGERRRLSVATMLVLEPRLLVLDEPTIGQDYERAQQLMGLMARTRDRYGTTILMITHDVRLVAQWADRALVLSRGRLVFDGTPENLFGRGKLLDEAGLLPPPIFDVSAAMARRHPQRVSAATLSLPKLVGWVVNGEPS
jgi:energy-coupling factor transport system ATP-binding protein